MRPQIGEVKSFVVNVLPLVEKLTLFLNITMVCLMAIFGILKKEQKW
ncbi:MAG: hypothetical protein ACI9D1_001278 [Cryomorphaceae bacterium]|jgi:hypothetical protein